MPNEPNWIAPPYSHDGCMIFGVTADHLPFYLATVHPPAPGVNISGNAERTADLFAAAPELYEALEPHDRLNAAAIIHTGYQSKSSVETMHLLHCCLDHVYHHPYRFAKDMTAKIHEEIERLMSQAERALEKARGESPDAP